MKRWNNSGHHITGLTRIHETRGPEMRVQCPGCKQARWVEYGEQRCIRCRHFGVNARRRGGILLMLLGTSGYITSLYVDAHLWHLPLWTAVLAFFGSATLAAVGFRRYYDSVRTWPR